MKKISLFLLFGVIFLQPSFSQNYINFPSNTAHWNCLYWHQNQPENPTLTNYQYLQQGDTIVKGKNYHKIYYKSEMQSQTFYIGGIREDSVKRIFFFPASIILSGVGPHTFPNDTTEQLLYSFNNLHIGDSLPINTSFTSIKVTSIDSVLLGSGYRKRYQIQNTRLMGNEYWIEGIGSTKDLLSPFTYEFEWWFFTLCYGDINTFYINAPNGMDSCHYSKPLGVIENEASTIKVYPNPANDILNIVTPSDGISVTVTVLNVQGKFLLEKTYYTPHTEMDISQLNSGLFFLRIKTGNKMIMTRFIKK
jgi:hypothetical protein